LKNKKLYTSSVDGVWGRNTLIALVDYSSKRLRTVDLRSNAIVSILLKEAKQDYLQTTKPVADHILANVKKDQTNVKKLLSQNGDLKKLFDRSDFSNLSSLKRKQLQYGLKKLGYYSSSIDGVYGPRTEIAVRDYARSKRINSGYPNSVYKRIVSEITVPNSFAVARKPAPKRRSPKGKTATNPAAGQAAAAAICMLLGGNSAGCIAGATGSNAPNPYGTNPSRSSQPSNSCTSNSGCDWGEVCIKKAGRSGQCFELPSGANRRGFKPANCSQSTAIADCGIGYKCDRSYNICVKR
jgi:hypothetical protein